MGANVSSFRSHPRAQGSGSSDSIDEYEAAELVMYKAQILLEKGDHGVSGRVGVCVFTWNTCCSFPCMR